MKLRARQSAPKVRTLDSHEDAYPQEPCRDDTLAAEAPGGSFLSCLSKPGFVSGDETKFAA